MLIFHSYVSLPEGIWENEQLLLQIEQIEEYNPILKTQQI